MYQCLYLLQTAVVIGFDRTSYSVDEEDGVVSVTVLVISGRLEKDIDVRLFTTDDSAVCKFACTPN